MSRTRRRTARTTPPTPSSERDPFGRPLVVAGLAGITALALYLATAARDLVVGDPTEFSLAILTGGVAHPPGYPLLTMLGQAFSLLPLEPLPFRLHLVSVVAGAASVAVVALTAHRLGAWGPAAAAGSLVFAVSPVVWRWSVVIEAFPLNDLLVAGIALSLIVWHSRPSAAIPLFVGALLGGLALTNHQTAVFIVPAVIAVAWQRRSALAQRPQLILLAALGITAGLLPYAYVPVASASDPAWHWGPIATAGDLWALVSRQLYGGGQLVPEEALRGGSLLPRVGLLLTSYWPIEGPLVLLGALVAYQRQRAYLTRTAGAVLLAGPLFVAYADIDPSRSVNSLILERFFLMPHVLTAPLIGVGIATLISGAHALTRSPAARHVALASTLAATAALAVSTYASVDRREDRIARGYGLDILDSVPAGSVLLSVGDDVSTTVAYLQLIDGHRRDVIHVVQPLLRTDWYVRDLRRRHPDVAIPFAVLGQDGSLRQLLAANRGRTFVFKGGFLDATLAETHWAYTRGLVQVMRPLPPSGTVEEMAKDNEALLTAYHIPARERVRGKLWERVILADYARPAFLVGQQYEIARRYADARSWYQRALSIDPDQPRLREALDRLPRP